MLIYEVSGIFAHKKIIKQFLQSMIEQVWGGSGCAVIIGSVFQSYYIFVSLFCQFTNAFLVDFTNICIFFAVYYVYFIKRSNSVLGTKFS